MRDWEKLWFGREFERMLEEEKRWRELVEPTYARVMRQIEEQARMLADPRTSAERMLDQVNTSLAQFAKNQSFDKMQALTLSIGREWQDRATDIRRLVENDRALALAVRSHTARMAEVSMAAELLYQQTDWEKLRVGFDVSSGLATRLMNVTGQLTRDYSSLIDSLVGGAIYSLPPAFSALPAVEVFLASDLAYTFAGKDAEAAPTEGLVQDVREGVRATGIPEVEVLLDQVGSELRVMLDGARSALTSKNPDRGRHVATSMREVFTRVLHQLAPDDQVRAWNAEPSFYSNKKPTRRARLLFIVRLINSGPLSDFMESDVKAALTFLDAFQAGTHGAPGHLSDEQLAAMVVRMEGLLRFLLEVGLRHEPFPLIADVEQQDAEAWDRQFEADVNAGKLDALAERALQAHAAGQSKKL